MSLSDKRMDSAEATCRLDTENIPIFLETDVKQFIKELKKEFKDEFNYIFIRSVLDKLAGDKLV